MDPSPTLPEAVFSQARRVGSYDVGPDHRLTVPGLLRQLHDVAQAHASAHGFGYRELLGLRRAWALVCIDLRFGDSLPLGEETFEVATSVHKSGGPVVYRDYLARGPSGKTAVAAQSMWALIDLDSRGAARPPEELRAVLRRVTHPILFDLSARRLRDPGMLPTLELRRVHLHDCDFNGHLNNVVTAAWLLDACVQAQGVDLSALGGLSITYHQELLRGEVGVIGVRVSERGVEAAVRSERGVLVANAELQRT